MLAPINKASVFLLFKRRREVSLKRFNICRVVGDTRTIQNNCSVICVLPDFDFLSINCYTLNIFFLFFLNVSASISAQRIKRYGERGKSCLNPLSSLETSLDQQLFVRGYVRRTTLLRRKLFQSQEKVEDQECLLQPYIF